MSEPAVPAPDGKVPAADREIVGAGDVAVPAFCRLDKLPEVVAPDLHELAFPAHIFYPWHKDAGRPAVIAYHLRLVRHGVDDLVCIFFTMITIRAVFRENKPVAHGRN